MPRPDQVSLVILCRRFAEAKQRLSPLFTPPERAELAESMFWDVLAAANAAASAHRILVVSDEPRVREIALGTRALILEDRPALGMNNAARTAIDHLRADRGAIILMPADIPLLQPTDLERVIRLVRPGVAVIISSLNGGTNLLAAAQPFPIELTFGPRSFSRHKASAASLGLRIEEPNLIRVRLDIDECADVERFLSFKSTTRTQFTLDKLQAERRVCGYARDVLEGTLWGV